MFQRRRRLTLCAFCVIIALLIILGTSTTRKGEEEGDQSHSSMKKYKGSNKMSVFTSAMASPCKDTLYPSACELALASIDHGAHSKTTEEIFDASLKLALAGASSARTMAYNLSINHQKLSFGHPTAMDDCFELMDTTLELLNDVLKSKKSNSHDIQTWLSAAITNQVTCKEGLDTNGAGLSSKDAMNDQAQSLMEHVSNSLALHKSVKGKKQKSSIAGGGRKLLADGYPSWVSAGDRKLLKASPEDIEPDAVVAQDGTGTHTSINDALAFLALKYSTSGDGGGGGGGRTVIYVKAGTYNEYIRIPTKQKNVMLMGDGKGKSVIVGSKSAEGGSSTYQSATVAAMGAGFIGKGLTIINSAGPAKHQAVALRVGADKSVVTQCSIQGYQDTLYSHSNRQFFRDNDISGTVDFIFGNSAVVFQNCYIQPRRPSSGQKNSITAQGRSDPNQNTGTSIQSCKIEGSSDLGGTPTYLGRPWHKYSRVVVMESYLGDAINSAGWEQWSGGFALSTLYYAEYANTGPGASTSGRVSWPGVHTSISSSEASKFTVSEFIVGDYWLPGTGVDYNAGL